MPALPEPDPARARALEALREVIDPELGLDVVALGLVYGIRIEAGEPERLHVELTMTTPACPLGESIVRDAEARLEALDPEREVHVQLVWDPPWDPGRMSPEAKQALGWDEP
ncbi:MAG: metal-sulfur cluster assembly factor [Myxococcales bacterium]|nr:metal-sulfur cluster assembly factor [Myxococcales bacterium]